VISWDKKYDYYLSSKEGYRISKSFNGDKPIYTAWDSQRGNNRQIIKGNCKTLDEAKAECELYDMRIEK